MQAGPTAMRLMSRELNPEALTFVSKTLRMSATAAQVSEWLRVGRPEGIPVEMQGQVHRAAGRQVHARPAT